MIKVLVVILVAGIAIAAFSIGMILLWGGWGGAIAWIVTVAAASVFICHDPIDAAKRRAERQRRVDAWLEEHLP